MFKSTMHSAVPATFNMALLFDSLSVNKVERSKFISFLINKNIRDYRIAADESLNKGHSFCDLSFDLVHHLFESINFHQLFGLSNQEDILQKKVDVYNGIVNRLNLAMLDEYRDALISDTREYAHKFRLYIKPLIMRSVDLHKSMDEFNTVEEGVYVFWKTVDHVIFTNKVKHELEQLKTVKANQ